MVDGEVTEDMVGEVKEDVAHSYKGWRFHIVGGGKWCKNIFFFSFSGYLPALNLSKFYVRRSGAPTRLGE